jgi:hypothetical protein
MLRSIAYHRDGTRTSAAGLVMPALPAPRLASPTAGALPHPACPVRCEPGRDIFVDALRTFGVAVVVLLHWSMPVLSYSGGTLVTRNALATPGAFPITWIGQVMPLVFFVGGAANAISWRAAARRGTRAPGWLARRLRRLAWPVLPVAAVMIPLPHLLLAVGIPEQPVRVGAHLVGQLLWFLAAYLIPVALTPLMIRVDERCGWRAPAALLMGAVLVDVARFSTRAVAKR